jgi:hypothetical protein
MWHGSVHEDGARRRRNWLERRGTWLHGKALHVHAREAQAALKLLGEQQQPQLGSSIGRGAAGAQLIALDRRRDNTKDNTK